jgi:DNA-binding transcriptional LysR family regulator
MDLRKLTYFQVHVSPPALTKGIQALEQDLGLDLFHRKRGRPVLTGAGELLLERAQRMLDEAQQIRADMDRLRGLETGRVRIGCGPIVVQTSLSDALAELSAQHPGIQVIVSTGDWQSLTRQLLDFSLDIVSADIGQAEQDARFHVQPLGPEPVVWMASPSHPLARQKSVTLEQVLRFPLALPTPPEHMVRFISAKYGDAVAGLLSDARIRSDSYATLTGAVSRSHCLTAVPLGIAEALQLQRELLPLHVSGWELQSRPGLITLAERAPSAARDALVAAFLRRDRQKRAPG